MHESRGNADCRVFGCPRIKRGAPDLRVIQSRLANEATKPIRFVAETKEKRTSDVLNIYVCFDVNTAVPLCFKFRTDA